MTTSPAGLTLMAVLLTKVPVMAQPPPLPAFPLTPRQEEALIDRLLPRVRGADRGVPLPTESTARAYAEQVVLATEGQDSFARQGPYQVEDRGETWFITGTRSLNSMLTPVRLELRKRDAAVVQYGMTLDGLGPAPTAR